MEVVERERVEEGRSGGFRVKGGRKSLTTTSCNSPRVVFAVLIFLFCLPK